MTLKEIAGLTDAQILCGARKLNEAIDFCFASDLMSDVLTLKVSDVLLITGLVNIQSIRTAEMSDIPYILFVRNKEVTPDMIKLAEENDMLLMKSNYSMFKASGILFEAGLKGIF
ncbi:MAG: hypothetical protein LBG19_09375 [Prevotellaceae bacterium]|jgi:predicted transcriptional regulator|nr:hypothetical protein [Prevotellaceae bacterium]